MKALQLPIISNSATTGHKLQGKTVKHLFIGKWHYGTNWPYVVLSRVTTLNGLFLLHKLDQDITKYAVPEKLKTLLRRLGDNEPDYDISDRDILSGKY